MDDLEDDRTSELYFSDQDQDDQGSLDEQIDSEQRLYNQQLWASFQNAACCITKLYNDRTQPQNPSPWIPFQNAASNLTKLYKDCIDSQKRFARVGYRVGRRRRMKEINKFLKKHKIPVHRHNNRATSIPMDHGTSSIGPNNIKYDQPMPGHQSLQNQPNACNVASILAVNQLNLHGDSTDDLTPQHLMHQASVNIKSNHPPEAVQNQQHCSTSTTQLPPSQPNHHASQHPQQQQQQPQNPQNPQNPQVILGSNEDDLLTFQQALAQPAASKLACLRASKRLSGGPGYIESRNTDSVKSEDDRLSELNQFLSEEYHRHVGSKKRSSNTHGGSHIKRFRD